MWRYRSGSNSHVSIASVVCPVSCCQEKILRIKTCKRMMLLWNMFQNSRLYLLASLSDVSVVFFLASIYWYGCHTMEIKHRIAQHWRVGHFWVPYNWTFLHSLMFSFVMLSDCFTSIFIYSTGLGKGFTFLVLSVGLPCLPPAFNSAASSYRLIWNVPGVLVYFLPAHESRCGLFENQNYVSNLCHSLFIIRGLCISFRHPVIFLHLWKRCASFV